MKWGDAEGLILFDGRFIRCRLQLAWEVNGMNAFDSVRSAAEELSASDRLRLLAVLWDTVSEVAEFPLHEAWANELERRVNSVRKGAPTTPWPEVRDAALARIRNGEVR
jgi:putative addiction module component (TIGR02574 family)